jgi:hypothetical protein
LFLPTRRASARVVLSETKRFSAHDHDLADKLAGVACDLFSVVPARVREDPASHAATVERLPHSFRLRQTIRHCVQHRRIDAETAVAAHHLDALRMVRRWFNVALGG